MGGSSKARYMAKNQHMYSKEIIVVCEYIQAICQKLGMTLENKVVRKLKLSISDTKLLLSIEKKLKDFYKK